MKYIHILRSSKKISYVLRFINDKKNAEHIITPISEINLDIKNEKGKLTIITGDLDSISEKIADELIKGKSKVIVW